MKKKQLILASLLGVAAISATTNMVMTDLTNDSNVKASEEQELFNESTSYDMQGVAGLVKAHKLAKSNDQVIDLTEPKIGYEIATESNGKISIRFFAAITSLDVEATWIRGMYDVNGNTYSPLKEKSFNVTNAYTGIKSGDSVIYATDVEAEDGTKPYKYFVVYTLKNIPAEYASYYLDARLEISDGTNTVSSKAGSVEAKQNGKFFSYKNVENNDLTLDFDSTNKEYSVTGIKADSTATEIVVPAYVKNENGRYPVTKIVANSASTKNISKVEIPDTIEYIAENTFVKNADVVCDFAKDYADVKFAPNWKNNAKSVSYNKCTITYNTDGGSEIASVSVKKGSKTTKPANPTKDGYTFSYWEANGSEFDFNSKVTGDVTLVARYSKASATINGFGGDYTPWTNLRDLAGVSGKTAFGKTVELNGFKFIGEKQRLDSDTSYNSQSGSIEFTVNGDTNNFHMKATSGSSDAFTLTIKKGDETIYTAAVSSKGSANVNLTDLAAGTYTITAPKTSGAGDASLKITSIYCEQNELSVVNVENDTVSVNFNTNGAEEISPISVKKGNTITLPTISKSGYKFGGWYLDGAFTQEFNASTAITENTTLFAKWNEATAADKVTVSFVLSVAGQSISSIEAIKGETITLPSKEINGYRFVGYYTDEAMTKQFNANTAITADTVIYAKYQKQWTVTFKDIDGNVITNLVVDEGEILNDIASPNPAYIDGKAFEYWADKDGNEFKGTTQIDSDITLKAVYKNIDASVKKVVIVENEGLQESAYIEFNQYSKVNNYSVYEVNSGKLTKLSEDDYYLSQTGNNYRVDIFGLEAGSHTFMVVPVLNDADAMSYGTQATVNVEAYDRSGYAHFNTTEGVGAYNNDGTLKDNAIVLYVTDDNKNDIELSFYDSVNKKNWSVKGIGNILNSAGKDAGTGTNAKGGAANTNGGVMLALAQNNIPLVVRFVGCVSNTGLYKKGTFNASTKPLIDGLTVYDSVDWGGSVGDNGHMARIQSGKNITLEGVGSGSTIDGWGFHLICQTANPDYAKNFEVRNLKFINTPEDAIGMEGQQEGSAITAGVEHCWVHNNEFYCPSIGSPAESDKSEGDGSVDFKRGQYFTCSYNYFESCHKTNLVGSSDSSLQFNLSYHHNFWYNCAARGPLARQANIHMYNNLFFGQSDYAMNTRANAYIYSEYNLMYACKNAYRVDSGAIKSFGDSVSSLIGSQGQTIVTDKNQKVSNNCKYGSTDLSSFELDSKLSYIPTNDYYLQTDVSEAMKVIAARCGVAKDTLQSLSSVTLSQMSIADRLGITATVNNLKAGDNVAPGKIQKAVYAFRLDDYAKVTVSYSDDTDLKTGVLVNEAGVAMIEGSGTVVLEPGIYYIQPDNFQPGSPLVFKTCTINSISVAAYNSTEYTDKLKDEFNNLVAAIPATITYNDSCYNAINAALNKYNSLNSTTKAAVESNYQKVLTAYNQYKNAGISYVEGEINKIVTPVTTDNSYLIDNARKAYNTLLSRVSDATVSNYSKLTAAETEKEDIAISIFINKVNKITSVKYDTATLTLITDAEEAYDSLSDEQKGDYDVKAAYQNLVSYRSQYDALAEEASMITVTFMDGSNVISSSKIKADSIVTLPTAAKSGYRLDSWYYDAKFSNKYNGEKLSANTTLYAYYIEQVTVTFKDGSKTVATVTADKGGVINNIPGAEYKPGYSFQYWSLTQNGSAFDFTNDVTADTTLYAVYTEASTSSVNVTEYAGGQENIYAKFEAYDNFKDYNVYVKSSTASSFTKVDKQLIRRYANNYRVDVVGIKAGSYSLKIVPVNNNSDVESAAIVLGNINVIAHERTGFGFVNGSSSGAYNDDGTLKSNAKVIYVASSNKDTVTLNGAVGVQNIITAMKGGKTINYPVCIRVIGNITDPANMAKGDLYVDDVDCGLTIEGIGTDATMNGFGIVIKNSSNVEIRNVGFMNCDSSEGDDCGLQQANDHIWVHNCDFFYGDAGSDADQAKGDGALDTKKSSYVTHSFNHFWDNGKCNLQGMKSESTSNCITYHHNWYDHSDSRHPRIRTCTVHIYNNYFDGCAKYGVGMTMGGSAFVENNYFRSTATMKPMLTSNQGTDALGAGTFSGENGGIIKEYGNTFDGNASYIPYSKDNTQFDAYDASSRNEQVPSSVKAVAGGTTYNNFDTASNMYSYTVETAEQAKATVTKYAGRVQGGDFKWTFDNATEDSNYAVISGLKSKLMSYKESVLEVLGIGESSQGQGGQETPAEDTSVTDVISMIDNLPAAADITLSDLSKIEKAEAAYNNLSSDNKSKVTNYTKLVNCRAKYNELAANQDDPGTSDPGTDTPSDGTKIECTFTYDNDKLGVSNSFFTISGKGSNGSATINGVTYTSWLKIEKSTTISFTTKTSKKLTLHMTPSKKITIDGVDYTSTAAGLLTVDLKSGSHSIAKKDSGALYYICLE